VFRRARGCLLGTHVLAIARAEHLARQKRVKGEDLYELVKAYALAAAAVRNDSKLPAAAQARTAGQYAAEAVRLLERAHAAGIFNDAARVDKMKRDHDLDSLRAREDYQKVLRQVALAHDR
jgi:hypothetical protein